MSSSSPPVGGLVAPGFELVEERFRRNFAEGREIGAGYCAYVDGKCVVNLFGGWQEQERRRPFTDRSLTVVYSCGKAVQGTTIAHMVSRGIIRHDDLVSKYWPEFAQGGKELVTIKDICQHMGGIAWLDEPNRISISELSDLDAMAAKVALQPHNFGGQLQKAYHATTQGWVLNEIMRRTLGKTQGQFVCSLLNPGLGVDFYCGFDVDDPAMESRYAPVVASDGFKTFAARTAPIPGSVKWKIASSGPARTRANEPAVRRNEIPSAFCVTNAASLARIGALCSMGGSLDGFELIDPETMRKSCELEPRGQTMTDLFTDMQPRTCAGGASWARNAAGFVVPTRVPVQKDSWKGLGWEWTGWGGTGGSHFQWDLNNRVSSAYVMNLLEGPTDTRGMELALELTKCVEKLKERSRSTL